MIFRLTFSVICALYLSSCKDEETASQDRQNPETASSVGSGCDFPAENQITFEKAFPEDILDSWGYITTEVAECHHAIRSKKNYGDSNEAFYPRFHLAKAEFKDSTDATTTKIRIEAALETDAGFKDYTQILQRDATLYSVSATSNYTYLSHQTTLLERAESYLTKQVEQAGHGEGE